jgi:hypothetical protein
MLRPLFALTALLLMAASWPAAAADTAIGLVSRVQGEANWVNTRTPEPLAVGAPVFTNQRVATGPAARLELTFDDGTKLTLGENATMTLDTFVYDPGKAEGGMKLTVKGAFRFLAGAVAKQPDAQVAVATPIATVGVRGTEFWGGPIDDQALGVFLIEGSVTVTNAAGAVILDTAGQGTNIASPGAAPGAVTLWPQEKVDRALATVTFQ